VIQHATGHRPWHVAGLLVNPGLEDVWLVRDGDTWHPSRDPGFAAAGLASPGAGIPIGVPAAGVTGRLADGFLSVAFMASADRPGVGGKASGFTGRRVPFPLTAFTSRAELDLAQGGRILSQGSTRPVSLPGLG
jgi:hypothetical protein